MTDEEAPAVFEINRDVDCSIYAAKYNRMAGSPAAQFSMTVLFDAQQYARLCAVIGTNLKGRMTMHIVDIQAPLPDEEDEDPKPNPDQPPLTPTTAAEANKRTPRPRAHVVNGSGEAIVPHGFKADDQNALLCRYCQLAETAEIHESQAGLEGNAAAAALVEEARLEESSRREVDPAQAADAEAALAARSRS